MFLCLLLKLIKRIVIPSEKIETVKQQFIDSGAAQATQDEIKRHTQKAFDALASLQIDDTKKAVLRDFGNALMRRTV